MGLNKSHFHPRPRGEMTEDSGYSSFPVSQALSAVADKEVYVLLESNLPDERNRYSYLFLEPVEILECRSSEEIESFFNRVENALDSGFYLAGFLSYELGYFFEPRLYCPVRNDFPLAWLGAFREPIVFDHASGRFSPPWSYPTKVAQDDPGYRVEGLNLNMEKAEYKAAIERIKRYIEQGETYQVNFTLKYKFNFSGSPHALYLALRNNQSVAYSAFIRTGTRQILSLSPELFFRKKWDIVTAKPMKGTAERGRTLTEDQEQAEFLSNDLKNRSENLMIVDLLRNDLGRLAKTGTVKVLRLFTVERYETLFQMTSTIEAQMKDGIKLGELCRALFPCGSVTGAPKLRTMEIIRSLEKEERGVYTGSIGFITPEREAVFNVAIRTVVLEGQKGEMGVGSGIVYDSDPEAEYEECVLKGRFLSQPRPEFYLIETMLWKKESGYYLLDKHLKRLQASAEYFQFRYPGGELEKRLKETEARFNENGSFRVRLLLSKSGVICLEWNKLENSPDSLKLITLSSHRTHSSNPFLFHKTTLRDLYDRELEHAREKGFFEVIFQNEKHELTEGSFTNLFLKKGDRYYTPSLECGLLNGVFRQEFIEKNPSRVSETRLSISDLENADKILVANSVRGLVPVEFKNHARLQEK